MREFIEEELAKTKWSNHRNLSQLIDSYSMMVEFYKEKTNKTEAEMKAEISNLISNDECIEELIKSFGVDANEMTEEKRKQEIDDKFTAYLDELAFLATELKNLYAEDKNISQVFYATMTVFKDDRGHIIEFSHTDDLEKLYRKHKAKGDVIKFGGFYKSNRLSNVKMVNNFFIIMTKMQSENRIVNNKLYEVTMK
jgi:hypothetical protein